MSGFVYLLTVFAARTPGMPYQTTWRREHCGQAMAYGPFSGSPLVLLLTTVGRPASLICGGPDGSLIIQPSLSWPKRFAYHVSAAGILSLGSLYGSVMALPPLGLLVQSRKEV